jgi:uncharacterized LabA/DUF88 family protein
VHPDVTVFVLVTGDSDYTPLVRRLREFGKWVVGVGTEATASHRLASVCSGYKYWAPWSPRSTRPPARRSTPPSTSPPPSSC